MKLSLKYVALVVVGVLLAIFFLGWHFGTSRERSSASIRENAYDSIINRITIELNNKTLFLSSVNQEVESLREAKRQGDLTNKELKALNLKQVNELSRLKFRIDTLLEDLGHTGRIDTVYVDNIPHPVIELPFSFGKKDEWLTLDGNFNKKGVLDVNLKVNFSGDLWAGISKETKQNVAIFTTDCPYVKTITFNSIKLDTPKDKKYSVSLFMGYGFTINKDVVAAPVIAIGIGRSLFKF